MTRNPPFPVRDIEFDVGLAIDFQSWFSFKGSPLPDDAGGDDIF